MTIFGWRFRFAVFVPATLLAVLPISGLAQSPGCSPPNIDYYTCFGIGSSSVTAPVKTYSSASLGVTLGDILPLATFGNPNNGHTNALAIGQYLNVSNPAAGDWTAATTRVQELTDGVPQGYIDFNPPLGSWGMAFGGSGGEFMRIAGNGFVGIGTPNPQHLLHVNGTIGAQEVVVSQSGADYVFDPGYRLRPLQEVKTYIQEYQHLPDIPSAAEGREKGVGLSEMQTKLLAKIEELTLHMIQAEERNQRLEARIAQLEGRPGK